MPKKRWSHARCALQSESALFGATCAPELAVTPDEREPRHLCTASHLSPLFSTLSIARCWWIAELLCNHGNVVRFCSWSCAHLGPRSWLWLVHIPGPRNFLADEKPSAVHGHRCEFDEFHLGLQGKNHAICHSNLHANIKAKVIFTDASWNNSC